MGSEKKIPNRLANEKSPYLLQHAHNPVDWWPWCDEAFAKAKAEDKPVFLSIGYSTCHWCHVMARESFEDEAVAHALNRDFVSVKVDREQRPDIDGVYMRACQAMTGSGGWPTSVFVTADGKPFFAGTYFTKAAFLRLLDTLSEAWKRNRPLLLESGEKLSAALSKTAGPTRTGAAPIDKALAAFRASFDAVYGGFGDAPKFPAAHNLMFLLDKDPDIAEKTLRHMYLGGMFDHIGGGFSRYSTDRFWLIPHFEKMLYDNAMLAMAYLMAYEKTGKELYASVAKRIFHYLCRDMRSPDGGFYSAQDADTEGVEGKFYLFSPEELTHLLGEKDGAAFCLRYNITREGNFEGKSIPNLLFSANPDQQIDNLIPRVYEYRAKRTPPHIDIKRLTAWNALTAAALAFAARILGGTAFFDLAGETIGFIERSLIQGRAVLSGITGDTQGGPGFLDDYAFTVFALIQMHQATQQDAYLTRAVLLQDRAQELFWDARDGGFFFSGEENETLIARPKETWDAAMPSGNSVMAYNLSRLSLLTGEERFETLSGLQRRFMDSESASYPMGYGFYLWSSLPAKKIVCAARDPADVRALRIRSNWAFRTLDGYPLENGKTTFYVCEDGVCLPPSNQPPREP